MKKPGGISVYKYSSFQHTARLLMSLSPITDMLKIPTGSVLKDRETFDFTQSSVYTDIALCVAAKGNPAVAVKPSLISTKSIEEKK
ncbi:MAG: hypothetical protein ACJA09_000894 [Alcanivorax sp.]|jgi:hypothetical protein